MIEDDRLVLLQDVETYLWWPGLTISCGLWSADWWPDESVSTISTRGRSKGVTPYRSHVKSIAGIVDVFQKTNAKAIGLKYYH